MNARPLVAVAVIWVIGSALAAAMPLHPLLLAAGAGLAALTALKIHLHLPPGRYAIYLAALILSAGYYEMTDLHNTSKLPAEWQDSAVQLNGLIVSSVQLDGDKASFVVRARSVKRLGHSATSRSRERIQVNLRLNSLDEWKKVGGWRRGDAVLLDGTLQQPATSGNFGAFDYRTYLRHQRIHWTVSSKGLQGIRHREIQSGWSPLYLFRYNDEIRQYVAGRLTQLFPGEQSGYMAGLIIGLQDELDPGQYQQFSRLGLTHILAISGLHVAVFIWACMQGLRLLRRTRETALTVTLILIPLYVLFAGASPSVVRSGLMSMIALYAAKKHWLRDGLHIIGASAMLMLLWNPYLLLDVSFQLSFIVTAALIIGVPYVDRLLPIPWKTLRSAVSVTFMAQLASFPLTIYYFNQFSLMSLPANLLLVPFISFVVLPLGTFALLLGMIHPAAGWWLAWLVGQLNEWSFQLIELLNRFEQARMIWPTPSVGWIPAYYAALGCLLYSMDQRRQRRIEEGPVPVAEPSRFSSGWTLALCALAMIGLLIYAYQPPFPGRTGLVCFLDVGQGDSILVRTPSGRYLLIDGGGTSQFTKNGELWRKRNDPYEVGAKLLVPLLKKRGVHRLDYVIMTHADHDHIGGLQAVLDEIPVGGLIFNGTTKEEASAVRLMQTALSRRIPVLRGYEGLHLQVDRSTRLGFLQPFPAHSAAIPVEEEQNSVSLAFVLDMLQTRFLLTGDMEEHAERSLLNEWAGSTSPKRPSIMQPVDVLKVSHHGSRTASSAAWLDYWQPKLAVISVGRNNLYGHPNKGVLERLSERNISVFRTDLDGEIQMKVSRGQLQLRARRRCVN